MKTKYTVRVNPDATREEYATLKEARQAVKMYRKRWDKYAYIIRNRDGKQID